MRYCINVEMILNSHAYPDRAGAFTDNLFLDTLRRFPVFNLSSSRSYINERRLVFHYILDNAE